MTIVMIISFLGKGESWHDSSPMIPPNFTRAFISYIRYIILIKQHWQILLVSIVAECRMGDNPADTLRNNGVVITSKRRHFAVITSKWRRFDVITTLSLRHVLDGKPSANPMVTGFVNMEERFKHNHNNHKSVVNIKHTPWFLDLILSNIHH